MKKGTKKEAKKEKKILYALLDNEYDFTDMGVCVKESKKEALEILDEETRYDYDPDVKGKAFGNVRMLELEVVAEYVASEEIVLTKI